MAQIITDIVVHKTFVDGDDVLTWFDLHTSVAPPTATANWSHVEDGNITSIRVAFERSNRRLREQRASPAGAGHPPLRQPDRRGICRMLRGYSISPDGRYLVAAPSPVEPAVICDLGTGEVVGRVAVAGTLTGDGSTILASEIDECGWYHTRVLSDWRTGERLRADELDGTRLTFGFDADPGLDTIEVGADRQHGSVKRDELIMLGRASRSGNELTAYTS